MSDAIKGIKLPRRRTGKERIGLLLFLMAAISLSTTVTTSGVLYEVSFRAQKTLLVETARSQARLIEAMSRHDLFKHEHKDIQEVFEDSMEQLKTAHSQFKGIGQTGEFTLATLENGTIHFQLEHRHKDDAGPAGHLHKPIPFKGSIAEPIQLALSGKSGVITGKDYRGVTVLAAHEPIDWPGKTMGVVAKIDIAEIRKPFFTAFGITTAVAALLIIGGSLIFLHVSNPIVHAIEDNEKKLSAITISSNDAIVMIDATGKVLYWNPAAVRIFGYTAEDILGKDMAEHIIPPLYRKSHREGLKSFTQTGVGKVINTVLEISALRKGGDEFPIELFLTAINLDGHWHAVGTIRDITQRKLFEREIQRGKEELERKVEERTAGLNRSNNELSEFAYIVSHDLKAPLRAISSLANWIYKDYADKLDEEGKENLELLVGRTARMNNLIEGILHYSRVGRIKPNVEKVDSGKIARDTAEMVAGSEKAEITFGDLPKVDYDRIHLEQIFQNLIVNAVDHSGKDKVAIDISARDKGDHYEFRVQDNGQGIEEKHFERIFKIFQSLKPRDEKESTGIGLALVKKIVEQHGGEIRVESTFGTGSTFIFTVTKEEIIQV